MRQTLVFVFMLVFTQLRSQEKTDSILTLRTNEDGKHYFGLNAGLTTGLGLSYIYMPAKNGFQVSFLPVLDKENQFYSLGFTYLRHVKDYKRTSFLFFCGNHLVLNRDIFWNIGMGPGVHFSYFDFDFHFMLGYGILNIPTNVMTRPVVEFGAFYQF